MNIKYDMHFLAGASQRVCSKSRPITFARSKRCKTGMKYYWGMSGNQSIPSSVHVVYSLIT